MKKILVISLGVLVLFLMASFVRADVICYKNKDCDDGLPHTQDICLNPKKETSYCKNIITNPYFLLDLILQKLTELVNKEWEINVEPNIIVNPPEVNVYPDVNVTLPEKECKWEKYYFDLKFDDIYVTADGFMIKYINIPPEQILSEFRVTRAWVDVEKHSGSSVAIYVNDTYCGGSGDPIGRLYVDLSCNSKFSMGRNKVKFSVPTGGSAWARFHSMGFETEVKPANC